MMTHKSVFDALSDTPSQSANLKLKAQMMEHIQAQVATLDGTQAQIAKQCGITQPRLNDLINGKMSKFSLDALVNINANLGVKVGLVFA